MADQDLSLARALPLGCIREITARSIHLYLGKQRQNESSFWIIVGDDMVNDTQKFADRMERPTIHSYT